MNMCVAGSRIVVTGAAGFIGSHLVNELLKRGAEQVVGIDNLKCGNWSNLASDEGDSRFVKYTEDFASLSRDQLAEILNGTDYLFHLAAEKHNQSIDSPAEVFRVNLNGTHALLESAAAAKVKKVVFTSSLYAYGRTSGPLMVESEVPEPWTIYGISKLADEHLLRHFSRLENLDYTTLRLFFIYGPKQFAGMGYKSVIMKNFEKILNGEAPTIFGDGKQSLDYTYVDDAVDALISALDPKANGCLLNLSSGRGISVSELIQKMLEVADSDLKPVFGEADWTAGTSRVGCTESMKKNLAWEANVSLEEGLRKVYQWMQSNAE